LWIYYKTSNFFIPLLFQVFIRYRFYKALQPLPFYKYQRDYMLVKTMGAAVMGVDAITIIVEVNVSMGQGYQIVGLPDIAIKESLQRTESAIKSNGFSMPRIKVVINLAPADIKKTGSAFDLPLRLEF